MISCCILLRGGGSVGDEPLLIATFARDFIDFDSRVAAEGAGGDTGTDIPPVGYGDESTDTASGRESDSVEPDVLLQHDTYVRFRVGWSPSGLLYFERVRLGSGALKVEYVGGNTSLLPDDEDQVFEIPKGPVRLDAGPYVVLLRPGPVDPLWPAPEGGTSRVFVRRSRLASQEDIDWWLRTNQGAATALSASARATASQSSRRLPGVRDWSTETHWTTGMEPGRNYKLEITLATSGSGDSSRSASSSSESTRIIAGNVRRPPRLVTVAPWFPGCLVLPKRRHVEPDGGSIRLTFWMTPQGIGHLDSARVDVYVDGRPLGRVPTPSRVARSSPAFWAGWLGVLIVGLSPVLNMAMAVSPTAALVMNNLFWLGVLGGGALAVIGFAIALTRSARKVSYAGPLHEPATE